jgi:tetrahedral aminopeptidase
MMNMKINSSLKFPSIGKKQLDLLATLSNAIGPSGDEGAIRKIVYNKIKPLADEISVDSMGNILAIKKTKKSSSTTVMVASHMDEVGFIITEENGKGLFSFKTIGGISPTQLAGRSVIIGKNNTLGVIGTKPIHQITPSERKNNISLSSLIIDVGPDGGGNVSPGDYATFATKFKKVGPSLFGKALDDRLGVATLITLFENAPDNIELQAAFTVQEELGLRGAKVAAYALNPDMAIAMDCTPALDHPVWDGSENTLYRSQLDLGPSLYIMDGSTIGDPRMVRLFENVAKTYQIPIQRRQAGLGSTDAGKIHIERGGIPSVSLSVPGRYLHTATSMVRLNDWENTLKLMYTFLSHVDKNTLSGERK